VLRVGRCCLVPQLRFQVAGLPFAGVASTISVKGFWFEKPGAKKESTATTHEIVSLSLKVLLFNQKPLNKMPAAATLDRTTLGRDTQWSSSRGESLYIKGGLPPDPLRPMPTAGQALFCLLFRRFTKE
jgi:hypothetical protein